MPEQRPDSPAPFEPVTIPEHQLLRQIGRGGGGEVWLARNTFGVYRAVKIVHFREPGRRQGSISEFAGIANFEPVSRLHDGLVDILQVGGSEANGFFYYVMELADDASGGSNINPATYAPHTLAQHIRQRGRLPIGECIRIGAAIASGLGFLHRQNLTHRDLKPSNIIFVGGFPKLADVGLVTSVLAGSEYVGTHGFIPPEGAGTVEGDIYSLGKILYEMSTGNSAQDYPVLPADFGTGSDSQELAQFSRIVNNACRENPGSRYASSDDLMTALLSFQFQRRRLHWSSGGRPLVWLISVIGATAGGGFVIFLVWRLCWLLSHGQ